MALTKTDLKSIKTIIQGELRLVKRNQDQLRRSIREEVSEIVIDASQVILEGVQKMFEVRDKRLDKIDRRLDSVDGKLTGFVAEQRYLKDEVKGLKGEFA